MSYPFPYNPLMFANPELPDMYAQTKSPQQHIMELYKGLNSLATYVDQLGNYYVPDFKGEWSDAVQYEPNSLVRDPATRDTYVSLKPVPKGVPLTDTEYWALAYPYSAQFEEMKKEFEPQFTERAEELRGILSKIESDMGGAANAG